MSSSRTDLSDAVLLSYQSKPMIAQGMERVGASSALVRDACVALPGNKSGQRMILPMGRSCQLLKLQTLLWVWLSMNSQVILILLKRLPFCWAGRTRNTKVRGAVGSTAKLQAQRLGHQCAFVVQQAMHMEGTHAWQR
jgi:hypothetical protein